MFALARGLRFASRQLSKTPGFTLTVVLVFALGIGATTAIFSLVQGILLRPLPFADPDRLVLLGDHLGDSPNTPITAREIGIYSNATSAFSTMGGYTTGSYELSGGAIPEQVNGARLTATMFPTLAVNPMMGRVFTQEEEGSHQPVAVIAYALWSRRYHRDPGILGKTINLDRRAYTIIGVMPRSFEFPLQPGRLDQAQVWVPMSLTADELSDEQAGFWGYRIIARLKPGVTLKQAAEDANRVAQIVMRSFPANMASVRIRGDVRLLREDTVGDVRPLLRTLFLAVSVVLLIACANVAGLLLVRAIRRRREYAVRLALGAQSRAIIQQSALEGLLLSVAGGALGLALAAIAIHTALDLLPDSMPRVNSISMNPAVVAFALVLAVLTGAICSLAPAFAALRTNLTESLKDSMRASTGGTSHTWLRSALVVGEIGVALVLVTVASAFVRSFQKMRSVDPGFRPDHLLVAGFQLPLRQYPTSNSTDEFNRELTERLSSKPGVEAVGITNLLPGTGGSIESAYTLEGEPASGWKLKLSMFAIVYGDYFQALSVPLLDGRYFTENDRPDSEPVVIVNQSMAKHSWPGQRAIGKRMHIGNPQKPLPWATVIGVVADTKLGSRDEPSTDQWYMSSRQPAILFGPAAPQSLTEPTGGYIALRTGLPPEQMIGTLRTTVAEVDPLLALDAVQPMSDAISHIETPRRFNTDLITTFAAGALLLAITGIYSVVAFSVSLRKQEMAIRVALGAQRRQIVRLVLTSGAKMALLGCILGVLGSLAVSRLVSSFLFDVSATDPVIYMTAVLVMLALSLVASILPARRAASADPSDALRAS